MRKERIVKSSHPPPKSSPSGGKKQAAALRVVAPPPPTDAQAPAQAQPRPGPAMERAAPTHGAPPAMKPMPNRVQIETRSVPDIQAMLAAPKGPGMKAEYRLPLDRQREMLEEEREALRKPQQPVSKGLVALPYTSRSAARLRRVSSQLGTGIVPTPLANRMVMPEAPMEAKVGGGDLRFHNPGDAGPGTTISYLGGATIPNVPVQLIFWGSVWTQPGTTPSAGSFVGAVQNILAGPYMSALGQYGIGAGHLRGALIVTSPQPPNPFTDDDVRNLVWDMIDQNIFPEPDDSDGANLYVVVMPPFVNPSNTSNIGEHLYATDYDFPFDFDKAWCAWLTNDGTLDTLTTIFSHELVEACTDPEGNAWQINPTNSSSWNEIGDACQSAARLDGVMVQSYWSDRDRVCIIPTGTLPAGSVAGIPELIQSRFGTKGNFELVTPMAGGGLAHYWRNNDDPFLPWYGPYAFGAQIGQVDAVTMIESNFGSPGNLEVVARVGDQLSFFWRDSGPGFIWNGPYPLVADDNLVTGAAGNPVLIQSRFGSQGNFELVVPLAGGGLAHFWRDNDDPSLPWHGPYVFGTELGVVGDVTMIESNFGDPGNLEVIVSVGTTLFFFWRDSGPAFNWNGPYALTMADGSSPFVAGNPVLIQSRFGEKGNFELIDMQASFTQDGGIVHMWRDNDNPSLPWYQSTVFGVGTRIDGLTMIESNFGSPGNLEVVARSGDRLVFFWRDSGPVFNWNGPFPITA
jgi:hypothetical protein